jgi:hypothetical protein
MVPLEKCMPTLLDECHRHGLPTTADRVGQNHPDSSHRYRFVAFDPANGRALQFTLGMYQHTNVVDAGLIVIDDGVQHNVRASRPMRPVYETHCGPMRLETAESMGLIRLSIAPNRGGIHGELDWTGELPAFQESHQIGSLNGWLEIDGIRRDVDRWWSWRDRSWGSHANEVVPERITDPTPKSAGVIFASLFFSTERYGAYLQVSQSDKSCDISVELIDTSTGARLLADRLALDATFVDEKRPRRFRSIHVHLVTTTGESVTIDAVATGSAIVTQGAGYGGYDDGLGRGIHRGDNQIETDRYNVSHPADVTLPDSTVTRPVHRIQPVQITLCSRDGVCHGIGGLTLIAESNVDWDGHLRLTSNPHAHPRHRLLRRR